MKKYIFIALVFIGTAAYAQTSIQPKFEEEGTIISATYFHNREYCVSCYSIKVNKNLHKINN